MVNVGGVSPGHESLVDDLTAPRRTPGDALHPQRAMCPSATSPTVLQAVAVPVAAHRHVSASGSINSWIALGRRPIVLAGAYTRELAERMPGVVTLVDDAAGLATAIEGALACARAHLGRRRRPPRPRRGPTAPSRTRPS